MACLDGLRAAHHGLIEAIQSAECAYHPGLPPARRKVLDRALARMRLAENELVRLVRVAEREAHAG